MRPSLAMHCTTATTCIRLLLFLAFTVIPAASSELCDPCDEAGLLAFKTSLGANSNAKFFSTWKAETPCCQWSGVYCTSGRVATLTFSNDDTITGTIPEEVCGLSTLSSLKFLNLSGLSGTIPKGISGLSALNSLTLKTLPGLSGNIPAEIFSVPSTLRSLELNDLPGVYGTIPEEISAVNFYSLTLKNLPGLTGSIPLSICRLSSLQFLEISSCYIYGTIPSCVSDIPVLSGINLSDNKLSGEIPASLGETYLISIILKQNRLTGSIPGSLSRLGAVSELDLSNNFLSGDIPASLARNLWARVDLSNNELTGVGSAFLRSDNRALSELLLGSNQLSFNLSEVEFPTEHDYFTRLDLSHNMIYGSIPAGINEMTTLQSFDVSYNLLCGEIPEGPVTAKFDEKAYRGNVCLCGSPLRACTTESGSAAADV